MAQPWIITLIPHFSAQQSQIDLFNSHWCSQDQWDTWSCQRRHNLAHAQTHTHTYSQMHTSHTDRHKAYQAMVCRNHESNFQYKGYTLWKQPSLKSVSSCCFTRQPHYPPQCCGSFALILAYPHFVAIIHYGLAFWHACKLANYRTASCHQSDSCAHKGSVEGGEFGMCCWWGLGGAKRTLAPSCFWPNIVNANCLIDTHCCYDLQRTRVLCCSRRPAPLPSCFVSVFPVMLLLPLCPLHLICIRGHKVS